MATVVSTDRSTELSSDTSPLQWREIGDYYELRKRKCQRVHSKKGKYFDLGLFYREGRFHAMTAWCSHMGGPLYNGEIEDYNGSAHIMCPWHGYMFDLETGKNEIGIRDGFPSLFNLVLPHRDDFPKTPSIYIWLVGYDHVTA